MSTPIVRYIAVDGYQQQAYPSFHILASRTNTAALWTAIKNLSDLAFVNPVFTIRNGALWTDRGTPTGPTPVSDAAKMVFTTAAGRLVNLLVPGVALTHYLADHETLNPADTQVAALITAALNGAGCPLLDARGNQTTAYLAGTRLHLSQPPLGRYL